MEKIPDTGKKIPLLVAGELPAPLPGASTLDLSAPLPDLTNFYVVVAVGEEALPATLDFLEAAGLSPDQVLVHQSAAQPLRHRNLASFGVLETIDGESGDELRSRVMARIEAQRQKKLVSALKEAQDRGFARRFADAELIRALDSLRITHALSCGYGLGPAAHTRALRACLDNPLVSPPAWQGDTAAERLIPEAAAVMVDAFARGLSCRETVRERAAALSFRARTELLHQVENCLGSILGGRHAA